jgi:N-acyl-D-aspartate/D-glutamate deacylase
VIDADGLFVCPGFVDMHTHSDVQLLTNPAHEAKVHQGVTLEVLGQDGLSYGPVTDEVLEQLRRQLAGWNDDPPGFDWSWRTVAEYLDRLDEGIAINAAYLVPHGTLRICAVGTGTPSARPRRSSACVSRSFASACGWRWRRRAPTGFHEIPIDWDIVVISSAQRPGTSVGSAAASPRARPSRGRPIDVLCDLLVEEELGVACIAHIGNEEKVRTIMTHPAHTAGSDGILVGDRPHPRSYGTFPRFAVYVRELGILGWEAPEQVLAFRSRSARLDRDHARWSSAGETGCPVRIAAKRCDRRRG